MGSSSFMEETERTARAGAIRFRDMMTVLVAPRTPEPHSTTYSRSKLVAVCELLPFLLIDASRSRSKTPVRFQRDTCVFARPL
jgi:hypothetical protein